MEDKYNNFTQEQLDQEFLKSCKNGDLKTIKYLLTSSNLKKHANIQCKNEYGSNALMLSAIGGNLDIVKYLLISTDLNEHVNIHDRDNYGWDILTYACKYKKIEIIKYLLTDINLKEYPNMLKQDNNGHNILIKAYCFEYLELSNFLILNMNIEIDNDTLSFLNGNNNKKKIYKEDLNMIKSRDLYNKLNNTLNYVKKLDNIIKI